MRIFCYGDSNTWGFSPQNGTRFPEHTRWPGVLSCCLGDGFSVRENGLNGRTLCAFGMEGDPLNGAEHLVTLLRTGAPPDLLILYLGINDLFVDPGITTGVLVAELEKAIDGARQTHPSLELLVLSPLPIKIAGEQQVYYREPIQKCFNLSAAFAEVCGRKSCRFLDTGSVISASPRDGVHIEAEDHGELGRYLCEWIRQRYPDAKARSD
jgi:lysophospholipase L1-like esterase